MGISFRLVDDCGEGAIRLLESYRLVDGDGNRRRFSSHGKCRARSEVRRHVCQGSKHYICACERRYRSLRKSSFPSEGFSFAKIVVAARACACRKSNPAIVMLSAQDRQTENAAQALDHAVEWPPSGIWSVAPIGGVEALKALKIRTYDKTGTEMFAKIAATATVVSFADLNAKLEAADINAVLSSGDGGAGRQFWKFLRNFSDIGYAVPLSFASISLEPWANLDDAGRAAILDVARETTERQWVALAVRLSESFARMRANGVVIDEKPPAEVMDTLRAAADASVGDWLARAGPEARQVFEQYREKRIRWTPTASPSEMLLD